jgi:hypothetical protein
LLHELRVGAIIDHIFAKDGSCKDGIDLFSANVANLAVEDEFVALGSDINGRLLAEEDKCEAFSVLH